MIIFEDLDKLTSGEVWKVFYENAPKLSGFAFPVIYTFQSAFSYDKRFAQLDLYFNIKPFPMIQLENVDGMPFEAGYRAILEIVKKRSRLDLFEGEDKEDGVLHFMTEKTGGSLRDLFTAINTAAIRAYRRKNGQIQREDAEPALQQIKNRLIQRVDKRHYEFLANICRNAKNRQRIDERNELMELLQAGIIFEHSGGASLWHNVHPLIVDYLQEQELIENGGVR